MVLLTSLAPPDQSLLMSDNTLAWFEVYQAVLYLVGREATV